MCPRRRLLTLVAAAALGVPLLTAPAVSGVAPLPSLPVPLPSLPLPSLPLPLPSLPLPSISLPSVPPVPSPPLPSESLPLPSVPVPTLLPVPSTPPSPSLPVPTVPQTLPTPTFAAAPNDSPAPTSNAAPNDSPDPTEEPTGPSEGSASPEPSGTGAGLGPATSPGDSPVAVSEITPTVGWGEETRQPGGLGGLVLPGLAVGVPLMLVIAFVVAQALGGAALLPAVRRTLGGLGFRGGPIAAPVPDEPAGGSEASP